MKAGGEAYLLAVAWRHSGMDPYRLYHGLDESYRPWGDPAAEPSPPAFPTRVKSFIYACGVFAEEEAVERAAAMSGAKINKMAGAG